MWTPHTPPPPKNELRGNTLATLADTDGHRWTTALDLTNTTIDIYLSPEHELGWIECACDPNLDCVCTAEDLQFVSLGQLRALLEERAHRAGVDSSVVELVLETAEIAQEGVDQRA